MENVLYNEQNVDTKYAAGIEPNLFSDTVLIPGVTYSTKYATDAAGQICVHKIDSGTVVEPGKPGRDFTDEAAKDELIPIVFNNNYQKSRKIYGVQAAAVGFAMGEEYLADALNSTKDGRQYSGLACMAREGTKSKSSVTVTKDNAVEVLTSIRKEVKDNKGKANFAIVSTEIYAILLQVVGMKESDDPAVVSGALIKRFGLTIIECNAFDNATAKYFDSTGTSRTVDLTKVEIIMGYYEAVSILDNFAMYRLIDSENFAGSKAQVEFNTAFKVNSPKQVVVKYKAEETQAA